ncbi:SixA phosphatase family protein [Halochromatium glycolicum]|jgi:phosphohistidine phosphatase|uniref:Phosphohistidine phosphatase n=1 Tax=Halochromatium glycolicum TaxID=85075 RepID=A0AAJ0U3V6_9GAMM|nr:histidine phosphatase family protein [Halochromatium glycolicum]MBK1704813.1 phosphohistidine phosphatase [Halochromatium glycolicum]
MSRELLLLRHAKSDWDTDAASDIERPLAKRGRREAPRIGEWLYREGLVPALIVSSPAERARETTLKVCKGLDYKKRDVQWDLAVYDAGLDELLQVLAKYPKEPASLLLVGHNPGLEDLLRYLTDGDLEELANGKLLPTAALARLEMPEDWSSLVAGAGVLVNLVRAKAMK